MEMLCSHSKWSKRNKSKVKFTLGITYAVSFLTSLPLLYHTDGFIGLKILCVLPSVDSLPVDFWQPLIFLSILSPQLCLLTVSHSWNHTLCMIFILLVLYLVIWT